ncbi:hypothetical protein [Azospirillum argentinense]
MIATYRPAGVRRLLQLRRIPNSRADLTFGHREKRKFFLERFRGPEKPVA